MFFQTTHPFDASTKTVNVGTQTFEVLKAESAKCGQLVIDAPAELGAVYGWARRTDLDRAAFDDAVAKAAAQLQAKLDAMTPEERAAYDAEQAAAAKAAADQASADDRPATAKQKAAPVKITR